MTIFARSLFPLSLFIISIFTLPPPIFSQSSLNDNNSNQKGWTSLTYPLPNTNPSACARLEATNVCDADNLLTGAQLIELDSYVDKLRERTERQLADGDERLKPCDLVGLELYVLLMRSIEIRERLVNRSDVKQFAMEMFRRLPRAKPVNCEKRIVLVVLSNGSLIAMHTGRDVPISGVKQQQIIEYSKSRDSSINMRIRAIAYRLETAYRRQADLPVQYNERLEFIALNPDMNESHLQSLTPLIVLVVLCLLAWICVFLVICCVQKYRRLFCPCVTYSKGDQQNRSLDYHTLQPRIVQQ